MSYNAFVEDLEAGIPEQDIVAVMLGSDEFFFRFLWE